MRQQIDASLRRFYFGKAHPSDPSIRQRKIRRAIAANAMHSAWQQGYRRVGGIELEGTV